MKNLLPRIYLCLFSIFMPGCHKEKDTSSPLISIVKPVFGSVYSINDTVWISAVISDDSKLESVKVSMLDPDQKPVLASQIFYPGTSVFNLYTGLPIDDIHLSGGTYSLQVKAFDGTNFTNSYIDILIIEQPTVLKSVVLVSRSGIYGTDISTVDGGGSIKKVLTVDGDYKASEISSYDQVLYTAGAFSGDLNAVFLPSGHVVWDVPLVSSPPYRYFEDVLYSRPLLYVAYYSGSIYGYNRQGSVVYSTSIVNNYFPEKVGVVNNVLLSCMKSKIGKTNLIVAYYLASGSIMQSTDINMDVVAFGAWDEDNVIMFGNEGNAGKIVEYTLSTNKIRFLREFSDGRIVTVSEKDNGNYFIAGTTAIHWYLRSTNTLVGFLPAKPNAIIEVDKVNQQLYVLYDHNLSSYDLVGGLQKINIPVADSVLALHLLYNK
jgi:hypothetical protein